MLCFSFPLLAQVGWEQVPVHSVAPPRYYHEEFATRAYIDAALWSDYLNRSLFLDGSKRKGIPAGVYKIRTQFIVDTTGNIALVRALDNPFGIGDMVQKRMIRFPYKWSPATQNGRPVKSYLRIVLVFDLREKDSN